MFGLLFLVLESQGSLEDYAKSVCLTLPSGLHQNPADPEVAFYLFPPCLRGRGRGDRLKPRRVARGKPEPALSSVVDASHVRCLCFPGRLGMRSCDASVRLGQHGSDHLRHGRELCGPGLLEGCSPPRLSHMAHLPRSRGAASTVLRSRGTERKATAVLAVPERARVRAAAAGGVA